jgi:hypothetical protein
MAILYIKFRVCTRVKIDHILSRNFSLKMVVMYSFDVLLNILETSQSFKLADHIVNWEDFTLLIFLSVLQKGFEAWQFFV